MRKFWGSRSDIVEVAMSGNEDEMEMKMADITMDDVTLSLDM